MKYGKLWYSVELSKDKADIFKDYLRKNDIRYEPSECYNLIHFECCMTHDECKATNEFLQEVIHGALQK